MQHGCTIRSQLRRTDSKNSARLVRKSQKAERSANPTRAQSMHAHIRSNHQHIDSAAVTRKRSAVSPAQTELSGHWTVFPLVSCYAHRSSHMRTCSNIGTRARVWTCIQAHTHTYMHAHRHTYACARRHTCTHVHARQDAHTHPRAHVDTVTHARTLRIGAHMDTVTHARTHGHGDKRTRTHTHTCAHAHTTHYTMPRGHAQTLMLAMKARTVTGADRAAQRRGLTQEQPSCRRSM